MGKSDPIVTPFYQSKIKLKSEVALLGFPDNKMFRGDCYDLSLDNFEINSASIDDGQFNFTIHNTGDITINFTRIWVNNVTDYTWTLQNFKLNIMEPTSDQIELYKKFKEICETHHSHSDQIMAISIYVDREIINNKDINDVKQIDDVIKHEKVHIDQMKRGDVNYDDKYVDGKGKMY